jgi:hypothetical protein
MSIEANGRCHRDPNDGREGSVTKSNLKEVVMEKTSFVEISELVEAPGAVLEDLKNATKTLMHNDQPLGHLIGIDHPLSTMVDQAPVHKDLLESFLEESFAPRWRQRFMNMYGVVPAKGAQTIDRLIGVENPGLMRLLPGRDHWTLWEKDGVPTIFTMQVYGMDMETHSALRDFCIQHGLVYRTDKRSWHYPGVSTLIVIEKNKPRR